MERGVTCLPKEYLEEMKYLTDEEYGRLIRALQLYSITGEFPELEGNERFYEVRVKDREDRFQEEYMRKANQRKEAGKRSAEARARKKSEGQSEESPNEPSTNFNELQRDGNELQRDGNEVQRTGNELQRNQLTQTQTQSQSQSQTQSRSRDNKTLDQPKAEREIYSESFERFWTLYPRKVAKGSAYKAWEKIKPGKEMVDVICDAVEAQLASGQIARNDKYTPHPATWLNGRRWEDAIRDFAAEDDFDKRASVSFSELVNEINA